MSLLLATPLWLQAAPEASCRSTITPWLEEGNRAAAQEQPALALALFERSAQLCRERNDRAGLASSLMGVGQSLQMLNRYAESESRLLEGWAIRQTLDDGDPDQEVMYYPSELMYLYRQWSHFEQAWQWGEVALAAKARLIGKNTVSYGTSLSNISGIALQTKEYARGLVYARQAMDTWAATSGENSTDHAWGMRDVGALLMYMGRTAEAFGYLDHAYRIRMAAFGENRTETQTSIADMAAWYTLTGNDRQALSFAQRALAGAIQRHGAGPMQASVALNRLSGIHLRLGESGKAWQEAEDGLRIRRAIYGDDHAFSVNAWQDVAQTALADNQLGRAQIAADAALAHCRKVYGQAATCAGAQILQGSTLMALGQYQAALDTAQTAAQLSMSSTGRLPDDQARAHLLAARAQAALGQHGAALATLDALEAALQQTPASATDLLDTIHLARIAVRKEQPDMAPAAWQALARDAAALATQLAATRGPSHPLHAQALLDAAEINVSASNLDSARQQAARALAIALANGQRLPEARAAAQLGALETGANAIFLGKQAINALQDTRAGTAGLPAPLRQGFVRQQRSAYSRLADHLLDQHRIHEAETVLAMVREDEFHTLVRSGPDPRTTRLDFTAAEQRWQQQFEQRSAKLRAGAQTLAQAREGQAQGVDNADQAWRLASSAISALLDEATRSLSALPATAPGLTAPIQPPNASVQGAPLARGVLQLTYLVTDRRLRIVAQRGGRRDSSIVEVDVDERVLAQHIASLRRSAQDPGQDARAEAQALYRLLIAPVASQLAGATSLSLSLDGVLRYLPFAMLHDGHRWLIERLPIALQAQGGNAGVPDQQRAPSMALFGQTQASGELPALPFVQHELQAVAAIEQAASVPVTRKIDADFTASALAQALPAHRNVHIASHFVLRSGAGDESYLLLGNGEKLSLAELAQQRYQFAGLDLLTLSACETAVPAGTDATGRELEGLAWLARQRGANNVLASLWRVSDQSTASLMGDFYRALAAGRSKPQALRQAQLQQLRAARHMPAATRGLTALDGPSRQAADGAHDHPFYWAGFILLGSATAR
ncbi:CHAT domain-containing tetratricopeptide repeat protein [Janthinobacterium aquaticum]|uniref:CHAT domain-containing tetratricopeptide repeat protein n=1 Tax=Janthinobacterium sp. FT58W TaxID=2654254 RepID=UPI00186ACE36|nr:CHAT domain-containing protein [Janthinobacterium sp. FT58W]